MVSHALRSTHRFRSMFWERISRVQIALSKVSLPHSKNWKLLLGFFFLLIGILLASIAKSVSEEASITAWLQAHFPEDTTLTRTFMGLGYQKVSDAKLQQKLYASLPLHGENDGTFWVDSECEWIGYARPSTEFMQPLFFTRPLEKKKPLPRSDQWETLGKGWVGLESVLQKSIATNNTAQGTPKRTSATSTMAFDTREIHF